MKALFRLFALSPCRLVFLFLLASLAQTAQAKWSDQNTFTFHDLTVTRPNDRWRVVENPDTGGLDLKYLRHGRDVVIRVYAKPSPFGKKTFYATGSKKWEKLMLGDYLARGFRFVEKKAAHDQFIGVAVDENRDYLFVHILLEPSELVVVDMIIDERDYFPFKDIFSRFIQNLTPNP